MLDHWQLRQNPFAARGGDYFLAARCEEALSRLLFVVEQNRRCGAVCGPEQCGKSRLLEEVRRQTLRPGRLVATLDVRGQTADDFAEALLQSTGCAPSRRNPWDRLADVLYGWRTIGTASVWLIDQFDDAADDLNAELLRLLRLLDQSHAAASVLVAARSIPVDARWRTALELSIALEPWTVADCREFIRQRLESADARRTVFTSDGLTAIATCAEGLPGHLLRLCDLALHAGWSLGVNAIDAELVHSLCGEISAVAAPAADDGAAALTRR